MRIMRFEEIVAWQEARKLIKGVYETVEENELFRKDFGLRGQVTRAAVSVMPNIAEGFSRKTNKEFIQFLYISKASSSEVQSILYVAFDRNYIDRKTFDTLYSQADKVSQLISGFIKYLMNHKKTQ